MRNAPKPIRRSRSFLVVPEPTDAELDPYLVDETTITLDDWRHQPRADVDVEIVRYHQPHYEILVA
jgi:hypothetical protein